MKELSPTDASILAMMASYKNHRKELLSKLSKNARSIGKAFITGKGSPEDQRVVAYINRWHEGNVAAFQKRRKIVAANRAGKMGTETITFPEEKIPQVVAVIRRSLKGEKDQEVKGQLARQCDELEAYYTQE